MSSIMWICHNGFYYVEICSLYTYFGESFYHEWMLNFIKCFSVSIKMIMWFLSFLLLMWYIILIDWHMLNHPCDTGMNSTWLWFMILFMCCWNQFDNILLRIFSSIFISDIDLQLSFLVVSLVLVSGWELNINKYLLLSLRTQVIRVKSYSVLGILICYCNLFNLQNHPVR